VKIGKTILEQANSTDKWAMMANGALNFYVLAESKENQGGVKLKVNELKHIGRVMI